MGWTISVGRTDFGQRTNAGVTTNLTCAVTPITRRANAQVTVSLNAGRTTSGDAGSIPACQVEQVWQNVLSILVGEL
ncbi:hypothetical protein [Massilia horti]|uniref:Uncharacterized protein n=1 Tax=Massilia horti TaxID=2562153 RepID=A0A4Y9SM62_9BURK|nr:hypothetical protein [Massilia horti]TFW27762.1 hypothetical protein E4O92_23155 [Massilia horti]